MTEAIKEEVPSDIFIYKDTEFTIAPITLHVSGLNDILQSHLLDWQDALTEGIDLTEANVYRSKIMKQKEIIDSFEPDYIKQHKEEYESKVEECNAEIIKITEEFMADVPAWKTWNKYLTKIQLAQKKVYKTAGIMQELINSILLPTDKLDFLDWKDPALYKFIQSVMKRFFTMLGNYD